MSEEDEEEELEEDEEDEVGWYPCLEVVYGGLLLDGADSRPQRGGDGEERGFRTGSSLGFAPHGAGATC